MNDVLNLNLNKNVVPVFGYKIYVRNETSHTQFSRPDLVHLRELKEQGMVLELPLNVCQKGHTLTLFFVDQKVELKTRVPDSGTLKESSFHAMVKVEKLEEINSSALIDLHFTQFDGVIWENILKKFSEHQKMITQTILKQHKVRDGE